jgi:amino acid transporter
MPLQPGRDTEAHRERETPLRRVLGLTEVTAGGVGMIIGAGIYVLLGAATQEAGSLVWLSFLMAAALAGLTGLSYAELSSMFPSAAGEYEYTRHALPDWVAFAVGWTMIVGLVVTAATVSIGFALYLCHVARRRAVWRRPGPRLAERPTPVNQPAATGEVAVATEAHRLLATFAWTAAYWVTETLPLPVTAWLSSTLCLLLGPA